MRLLDDGVPPGGRCRLLGVFAHPDDETVITFGPDGGYGHPDHVTISAVTTAACQGSTHGRGERLGRLGAGEFFGEFGTARRRPRSRDVVATASLTCLVLSPAPPANFAGRGPGARLPGALPGAQPNAVATVRAGQGFIACDVSGQVMRKVAALSAYRSQFPLEPGMFPEFLLQEIFGCEYFVAAPRAPLEEVPPEPVLKPALCVPPTHNWLRRVRAQVVTRMMPIAARPRPARWTQRSRSPSTTLASSTVTPG
jgi:LmbE family N-acetylglucosaminyl deacetylase